MNSTVETNVPPQGTIPDSGQILPATSALSLFISYRVPLLIKEGADLTGLDLAGNPIDVANALAGKLSTIKADEKDVAEHGLTRLREFVEYWQGRGVLPPELKPSNMNEAELRRLIHHNISRLKQLTPHREALITDLRRDSILPDDYEDNQKTNIEFLEGLKLHEPSLEETTNEVNSLNSRLQLAHNLQSQGIIPSDYNLTSMDQSNLNAVISDSLEKWTEKQNQTRVREEDAFKELLDEKGISDDQIDLRRRAVWFFRDVNRGAELLHDERSSQRYEATLHEAPDQALDMRKRFEMIWDSDIGKALIIGAIGRGAMNIIAVIPQFGRVAKVAQAIVETQALAHKKSPDPDIIDKLAHETLLYLFAGETDGIDVADALFFSFIDAVRHAPEAVQKLYENATPLLQHPLQFISEKLQEPSESPQMPTPVQPAKSVTANVAMPDRLEEVTLQETTTVFPDEPNPPSVPSPPPTVAVPVVPEQPQSVKQPIITEPVVASADSALFSAQSSPSIEPIDSAEDLKPRSLVELIDEQAGDFEYLVVASDVAEQFLPLVPRLIAALGQEQPESLTGISITYKPSRDNEGTLEVIAPRKNKVSVIATLVLKNNDKTGNAEVKDTKFQGLGTIEKAFAGGIFKKVPVKIPEVISAQTQNNNVTGLRVSKEGIILTGKPKT